MRRLILIVLLLLLPMALAQPSRQGHITLLTVSEGPQITGGTADLYLEIRPGNGAIYIDSFPLTRLDTQGSTRYANQIACDYLRVDCTRYDFFYTIRANSAIVGGPSAGAAMAVLTAAVLDGQTIDQSMAMTGTINSGGIIGPVAGVDKKIIGARQAGVSTVLIPALAVEENATNVSGQTQVIESLSDGGVTVVKVKTIEEALRLFTGKEYRRDLPDLIVPEEYQERMQEVANDICARMDQLREDAREVGYNDTANVTARLERLPSDRQYTRASLCFSANIELSTLLLQERSLRERRELYRDLRAQAQALEASVSDRDIETISDLEVYAIVKERIIEARTLLEQLNLSNASPASLAYAQERLVSAQSWSKFFGMPGKPVRLDQEYLDRACLSKITEADERINYVRLYTPELVAESEATLAEALLLSTDEPVLCIFTASQAKAQANLLASVLAVSQGQLDELLTEKIRADEIVVRQQAAEGFFPILGYSYMRYAEDLRESAPYNALVFSEYSLELSNLDMYFPANGRFRLPLWFWDAMLLFAFGAVFGIAVTILVLRPFKKGPERPVRRNRRTGPSREKR